MASYFTLRLEDKQLLLETFNIKERLELMLGFIETELDIYDVQQKSNPALKGKWKKPSAITI